MPDTVARSALGAATLALALAVACIVLFLPPFAARTLDSVLRTVLTGLALATAVLLHWAFLGLAARRLERSVAGWVALSALLFPVGSATALVLLGWLGDERHGAAEPAPFHG